MCTALSGCPDTTPTPEQHPPTLSWKNFVQSILAIILQLPCRIEAQSDRPPPSAVQTTADANCLWALCRDFTVKIVLDGPWPWCTHTDTIHVSWWKLREFHVCAPAECICNSENSVPWSCGTSQCLLYQLERSKSQVPSVSRSLPFVVFFFPSTGLKWIVGIGLTNIIGLASTKWAPRFSQPAPSRYRPFTHTPSWRIDTKGDTT